MIARSAWLVLAGTLVLAGCAPAEGPRLTVENRTDIPVGVYVDGDWIGTDEPGATIESTLGPTDGAGHRIEVRSPSGAVLAALEAPAAVEDDPGGGAAFGEIVAVPCGEIVVRIGDVEADATLAPPEAVTPGPCP